MEGRRGGRERGEGGKGGGGRRGARGGKRGGREGRREREMGGGGGTREGGEERERERGLKKQLGQNPLHIHITYSHSTQQDNTHTCSIHAYIHLEHTYGAVALFQ